MAIDTRPYRDPLPSVRVDHAEVNRRGIDLARRPSTHRPIVPMVCPSCLTAFSAKVAIGATDAEVDRIARCGCCGAPMFP